MVCLCPADEKVREFKSKHGKGSSDWRVVFEKETFFFFLITLVIRFSIFHYQSPLLQATAVVVVHIVRV